MKPYGLWNPPLSAVHAIPGFRSLPAAASALAACALVAVLAWSDAPALAAITVAVFGMAIIAWTGLRLPDTPVALVAALAVLLAGVVPVERLYASLGGELMWLLVAAFIVGAALRASGAAERVVLRTIRGARSVRLLFHTLALIVFATAFVVPSTSGRAALLLPVYLALAPAFRDARTKRALALLFPTAILLSACASLVGAGAHLVAVDFLARLGAPEIDFGRWFLLGAPFALVTTCIATEVILLAFLTREERRAPPTLPGPATGPMPRAQRYVLAVVAAAAIGWTTAGWHGIDAPLIALAAAVLATVTPLSGISMKEAVKAVEWNLLLFLAATLLLGDALVASGAAAWLVGLLADPQPDRPPLMPVVWLIACSAVALLSHIVITSRTARATVLIPTLALPLAGAGLDPAGLVLLVTIGSGFCQTLAVSAKPVALFSKLEGAPYGDADLLRLSLLLLPVMLIALVSFALFVWPWMGVPVLR